MPQEVTCTRHLAARWRCPSPFIPDSHDAFKSARRACTVAESRKAHGVAALPDRVEDLYDKGKVDLETIDDVQELEDVAPLEASWSG